MLRYLDAVAHCCALNLPILTEDRGVPRAAPQACVFRNHAAATISVCGLLDSTAPVSSRHSNGVTPSAINPPRPDHQRRVAESCVGICCENSHPLGEHSWLDVAGVRTASGAADCGGVRHRDRASEVSLAKAFVIGHRSRLHRIFDEDRTHGKNIGAIIRTC